MHEPWGIKGWSRKDGVASFYKLVRLTLIDKDCKEHVLTVYKLLIDWATSMVSLQLLYTFFLFSFVFVFCSCLTWWLDHHPFRGFPRATKSVWPCAERGIGFCHSHASKIHASLLQMGYISLQGKRVVANVFLCFCYEVYFRYQIVLPW